MPKIINIGCKLNQYEGFCLLERYPEKQNYVIVNTCCVTKEAEIKSLRKFRSMQKRYPEHTLIATGCACRLKPEEYASADMVIDNVERNKIIEDIFPKIDRSRYFLKIQDGCNGKCSFCIVAKLRSKIESKPIVKILDEIDWAVSHAYPEIVIVGANIGLYGYDQGKRLFDLLKELQNLSYLPRIRLSSLEPGFLDKTIIRCLKDLPFCRHFHLPIQSADDIILGKMNRQYNVKYLERIMSMINSNFNDCAIGADIIVGFPGETEKRFRNTYAFIKNQPFTHLHIFPYSPRPLTSAYSMGDPIDRTTKRRRLWQLKDLINAKNYEYRNNLVGKSFGVVIERKKGVTLGLTDNYIKVMIKQPDDNKKTYIKITEVNKEATFGVITQ